MARFALASKSALKWTSQRCRPEYRWYIMAGRLHLLHCIGFIRSPLSSE
jgi:hypothetical protein